jgi:hypothetical protein
VMICRRKAAPVTVNSIPALAAPRTSTAKQDLSPIIHANRCPTVIHTTRVGLGPRAPRSAYRPSGDERTPPPARRSEPGEAEGSLIPGTGVRAGSSPDNAETGRYCQMVRVRQARRRGIREEPATESPSRRPTSSNLADMGWVAARTRDVTCGELLGRLMSPVGRPR